MAMAFCFGSAPEIAAFMVAYRLANLFRRLLGEGNLQAGFIPHFEAAKKEGMEKGSLFYRDVSFSMAILLLGFVIVLEGVLACLLNWGGEIVELAMWMVPGLFFICLYGLNSALLQCQKRYFLPAVAPVAFNVVWIGAVFFVWHWPKEMAVKGLSIAVVLAFAGQWLATAWEERKILSQHLSWKEWLRPQIFSEEWKELLKPLSLGIVGIGAVQFNSALDAIFARIADVKGPAFLWYAIRLEQFPLALFGIALSGALLPPLARAVQDESRYRHLLQSALKSSAALMLPCTFGILSLGGVGINLLYGHGDFSPSDVRETLLCLWGYGVGLVPSVFVLLLANGYYAEKNYRIPTRASVFSVAMNLSLNAFFVFVLGWGAVSIAIATSLSAFANGFLLARGRKVFDAEFFRFFIRMGFCSAVPAVFVSQIGEMWMGAQFTRDIGMQLIQFGSLATLYLGLLFLLAWRMKLTELLDLFRRRTVAPDEV